VTVSFRNGLRFLTNPRSLTVAGAAQVLHLFPVYPAA
jgi:hypothetical protein